MNGAAPVSNRDELVSRNAGLRNDACSYRHKLTESLGAFKYVMDPVFGENPDRCYASAPTVRLGRFGVATCDASERIDVDSEIRLGIKRKISKCPSNQHSVREEKICAITPPGTGSDCRRLGAEFNRLLNPPCTLRGRSDDPVTRRMSPEFLLPCVVRDTKRSVDLPFANNVSNRLLAKDMHRPCVGTFRSTNAGAWTPAESFQSHSALYRATTPGPPVGPPVNRVASQSAASSSPAAAASSSPAAAFAPTGSSPAAH
jgi:hypothetical protein